MRGSIVIFAALLAVAAVSGALPKAGEHENADESNSSALHPDETAAVSIEAQPQKRQVVLGSLYNPYGYIRMGHPMMGYMGVFGRKRRDATPNDYGSHGYGAYSHGGYGHGGYRGFGGSGYGHGGGYGGGNRFLNRGRRDLSGLSEYNFGG